MSLVVYRDFQGTFQRVGTFTDGQAVRDRLFSYDAYYLSSSTAAALSHSLPLRTEPFAQEDYQGFFDGLVPEGPMRGDLSRLFQVPYSDYLALLDHLGDECIGALRFVQDSAPMEEEHYDPYTEEDVQNMLQSPVAMSIEMARTSRLSIAGAQTKFGVYIDPREDGAARIHAWRKPLGSAPSTHIAKVADDRFPSLPYNEMACMVLARECGLPVADVDVLDSLPSMLVVQRYDRIFSQDARLVDGCPVPQRLHQEDLCQALGWAPYMKYENYDLLYARLAGRLITEMSADVIADRELFAKHVIFDYVVGNCDGHLKNYSLLYSQDWNAKRLAPLYDIVCTTLLGFDRKMGMSIGDHIVIDEVTPEDWILFAGDIKVPENTFATLAQEMAAELPAAIERTAAMLPEQGQEQLERIVVDAQQRIHVLERVG